jgi:hypothetical protein
MNLQVYACELMEEIIRQLSRLERRKRGLGMLADALEEGMAKCGDGDNTVTMDSQKPGVLKSEPSAAINANDPMMRKMKEV